MDFSFVDKNSRCILIISANDDKDVLELLKQKVKNPNEWKIGLTREDAEEIG